jgi:KUP system potassium uptake protein
MSVKLSHPRPAVFNPGAAALSSPSPIGQDIAAYFAPRDLVVPNRGDSILTHARLSLFAFLYRNAVKVVDRFNLPPERVVEVARQIEI